MGAGAGGCRLPTEHHWGCHRAAHTGHCYGEPTGESTSRILLLCVFDFLLKRIHRFYNIKSQQRNTKSKEKLENRHNHLETHQRPQTTPGRHP